MKKGVLKNFLKLTGKHRCQSMFFNKVAGCNFIKKRLNFRCVPVNFAKFFKNTFFHRTHPVVPSEKKLLLPIKKRIGDFSNVVSPNLDNLFCLY